MQPQPTQPPAIYLLAPNLFGFKGGIQVYSHFFWQALQAICPDANCHIFLKYDRQVPASATSDRPVQFHCFGHFPRWLQSLLLLLSVLWRGLWERPQLLVATHLNYGLVGYVLKRLTGRPYWLVVHGLEGWNLTHPWRRLALRNADRVVAVSHYTRDRLLAEQALAPERAVVLPNTLEDDRFTLAPKPAHLLARHSLRPEQPTILTVSRLGRSTADQKGYRQILRALPEIRRQIPDVHYLLVGKGDDAPAVQALIDELGLDDCATLVGFVSDAELPAYYQLCDVFALPSAIEGFGIVYLEALACGKPVLAGDRDGAVDPLAGGELGSLVNPDDRDAIAAQLVQLLQGCHPNPLLHQPQALRQQTVQRFGRAQFRTQLASLLATFFAEDGAAESCLTPLSGAREPQSLH